MPFENQSGVHRKRLEARISALSITIGSRVKTTQELAILLHRRAEQPGYEFGCTQQNGPRFRYNRSYSLIPA
jgi:hypothetical protein